MRIIDVVPDLYSRTENVMKCGRVVSGFFPVDSEVSSSYILSSSLFKICTDWILGRVVDQCHCRASVKDINFTHQDDAVIFIQSQETLVMILEKVKLCDLKVS